MFSTYSNLAHHILLHLGSHFVHVVACHKYHFIEIVVKVRNF